MATKAGSIYWSVNLPKKGEGADRAQNDLASIEDFLPLKYGEEGGTKVLQCEREKKWGSQILGLEPGGTVLEEEGIYRSKLSRR